MLTIALIFHSARNANLGVGALTVSEVEIIRRIATARGIAVHIDVIDSIAEGPICVSGPDVAVRETRILRRPLQVFGIIHKADLVIDIGAGDSFADIYGRRRLIRLFMMKYMAHLAGRPLVLAPQTFGPFVKPLSRFFAVQSIKRAALVATRDRLSTDCARELGYRGHPCAARGGGTCAGRAERLGPVDGRRLQRAQYVWPADGLPGLDARNHPPVYGPSGWV